MWRRAGRRGEGGGGLGGGGRGGGDGGGGGGKQHVLSKHRPSASLRYSQTTVLGATTSDQLAGHAGAELSHVAASIVMTTRVTVKVRFDVSLVVYSNDTSSLACSMLGAAYAKLPLALTVSTPVVTRRLLLTKGPEPSTSSTVSASRASSKSSSLASRPFAVLTLSVAPRATR